MRCLGEAAHTKEGTPAAAPAPAPTPAAQVVRRGPLPRAYPPRVVALERFGGAEEAALLLDSDEARGDRQHPLPLLRRGRRGYRGAATALGEGLCQKQIGEWVQTEKIREDVGAGGGKVNKNHAGRVSATRDVVGELVGYINDCVQLRLASSSCAS